MGRLYIAQPDAHAVICIGAETGEPLWRFTTGGRVDSPPTIAQGIAVFGSRDGFIYALRAYDGALVWRFQAALLDRRLTARDQLESVWPLCGSVLVEDGKVYAAAGRNSYFDHGICLYKLDLITGKTLLSKRCYSRDPETGGRTELYPLPDEYRGEGRNKPGLLGDVFSSGEKSLFLRQVAITRDLELIGIGEPNLSSALGLLNDESWERDYWSYSTVAPKGAGYPFTRNREIGGRIIVFDDTSVFGFIDAESKVGSGAFSAARTVEQSDVPSTTAAGKKKSGFQLRKNSHWNRDIPLNVRAMVLSGDLLFMAGPKRFDEKAAKEKLHQAATDDFTLAPPLADALASLEGKKGSILWVMKKSDGTKLHSVRLKSAPVFDGMIAANGHLYISTLDGGVVCLEAGGGTSSTSR
jgi:outer membrane protein assembly factor BamB